MTSIRLHDWITALIADRRLDEPDAPDEPDSPEGLEPAPTVAQHDLRADLPRLNRIAASRADRWGDADPDVNDIVTQILHRR